MTVLLDSGILYAYYDRRDAWHERARDLLAQEVGTLIVPSPVIPEVDHMIRKRLGSQASTAFYEGLAGSSYFVVDLPKEGYGRVVELNRQFTDLDLGWVDAAIVAIAEGLGIYRIATTDRRDFGVLQSAAPLELVP